MDVVKRKVEALGGSVAVTSRVGRGTTIALRLPQSLALMRVLLVRLGDDVYGMPAADVEAVARFRPEDRMEVFGTLAVMHRGGRSPWWRSARCWRSTAARASTGRRRWWCATARTAPRWWWTASSTSARWR